MKITVVFNYRELTHKICTGCFIYKMLLLQITQKVDAQLLFCIHHRILCNILETFDRNCNFHSNVTITNGAGLTFDSPLYELLYALIPDFPFHASIKTLITI